MARSYVVRSCGTIVAALLGWSYWFALSPVYSTEVIAHGAFTAHLRQLQGQHIQIWTDLPVAGDIDELPQFFDAAVEQWAAYFQVSADRLSGFRPTAYLMNNADLFRDAGLFPSDLPPFPTGYQRQGHIWLYEQPGPYYRRHLLLHEGVHAFTDQFFGGSGPPWYTEGIAEYLALHRWRNGRVEVGINPLSAEEVPLWGRIKLIQQARLTGTILSLPEVMRFGADAHRRVEPYAWSWAAVFFFENHPEYRTAFRECRRELSDTSATFSQHLIARFDTAWPQVQLNWNVFVRECEFGYDLPRAALQFLPTRSRDDAGTSIHVPVDRGWLVTGVRIFGDRTYQLRATGRYQVAQQPKPWWCEPQGVTVRYYRGYPLGVLLAAVVPDDDPTRMTEPVLIGATRSWQPGRSGILCLKINDSPAALADNQGTLLVTVHPE